MRSSLSRQSTDIHIDQSILPPHRFVEVFYSPGVTQEIFQPVPKNSHPVDSAELLIPLFPFVSLVKFNRRLVK